MGDKENKKFAQIAEKLRAEFRQRFGGEPTLFRAPGRVNLIGEHTDYNDGFVMPAAIGFDTWVATTPAQGEEITVHSLQQGQTAKLPLGGGHAEARRDWTDYVHGVELQLQRLGVRAEGAHLLVDGHVPAGAGLSSSAAIEVATALALLHLSGTKLEKTAIAQLCQRAENEFVGARCGIMDQFTCLHGQQGHAILLDCRSLQFRRLPLPREVRLVICNTMVKHSLAAGEYNARRAECEACVRELSRSLPIRSLRDVGEDDLEREGVKLPDVLQRRLRHVVTENARVLQAAEAMESGDMKRLGELMYESHLSLRDDYEVSCRELDLMVELAREGPGMVGTRMTGGGFGGCTVNIVQRNLVNQFVAHVSQGYKDKMGIEPEIYVTEASDGASRLA